MANQGIYTNTRWIHGIQFNTSDGSPLALNGDYECDVIRRGDSGTPVFTFSYSDGTLDQTNKATGQLVLDADVSDHQPDVAAGRYLLQLRRVDGEDMWAASGEMLVGKPGDPETYISFASATDGSTATSYVVAIGGPRGPAGEISQFATVAALIADTTLTYVPDMIYTVTAGDAVYIRQMGLGYTVAASGATDHDVTTAGGVKLYVRNLDALAFGCIGDGVADDTAPLLKFVTRFVTTDMGSARLHGSFKFTQKLNFTGSASSTKTLDCACTLLPTFTSTDEAVRFDNIPNLSVTGRIEINGAGGIPYTARTVGSGIMFNDCRQLQVESIVAQYFKYWGVIYTGATSQARTGHVKVWYCGGGPLNGSSSKIEKSITFSANTGTTGSTLQRSQITMTPADMAGFQQPFTMMQIGTSLHNVMAFNSVAGTADIYPWVENGTTTATARLYVGGGVLSYGADSSANHIDCVDTLVCGIGIFDAALYPMYVGTHVAQYCGVGHTIGTPNDGGSVGGATQHSYFEQCDYEIVQSSLSPLSYDFVNVGPLTKSKCISLAPRLTGGTFSETFEPFNGLSINVSGKKHERHAGATSLGSFSVANLSQTPNAIPIFSIRNNSTTANLLKDTDNVRLFGMHDMLFIWRGNGVNDRPTGTMTFTCDGASTINGGGLGSSLVLSGATGPTLFHVFRVGTDWRVHQMGDHFLRGSATYDPPSIASGAEATTTVTVTGAALGDFAQSSFSIDSALKLSARVSGTNTVTVTLRNDTGSAIDLASGTLRAFVTKS